VTTKYFPSEEDLEKETALILHENKWPGGQAALLKRLQKEYPHYYGKDGKLKPFSKPNK
jgi:hypothetical protein